MAFIPINKFTDSALRAGMLHHLIVSSSLSCMHHHQCLRVRAHVRVHVCFYACVIFMPFLNNTREHIILMHHQRLRVRAHVRVQVNVHVCFYACALNNIRREHIILMPTPVLQTMVFSRELHQTQRTNRPRAAPAPCCLRI